MIARAADLADRPEIPDLLPTAPVDSVVEPVNWATGRGDGFSIPVYNRERSDTAAPAGDSIQRTGNGHVTTVLPDPTPATSS